MIRPVPGTYGWWQTANGVAIGRFSHVSAVNGDLWLMIPLDPPRYIENWVDCHKLNEPDEEVTRIIAMHVLAGDR